MKTKNLIALILNSATSKQNIHLGLDILKENECDYFSLSEHEKEFNHLNKKIFSYFLTQPTDREKEILTRIWNHDHGIYRKDVDFLCRGNTFGRELLKSFLSEGDSLINMLKDGSMKELKTLMGHQPNIFKENISLVNRTLEENYFSLEKMLICEKNGIDINLNILTTAVDIEEKLKKPDMLFNFISRHRDKVSPDEWDNLILKMIQNCKQVNWNDHTKRIADSYVLVNSLNHPEKYPTDKLFNKPSIIIDRSFSDTFFDPLNKNLSSQESADKFSHSIEKTNYKNFMQSDIWDKINPFFSDDMHKKMIVASMDSFVIDSEKTPGVPAHLKLYDKKYLNIKKNPVLSEFITEYCFNNYHGAINRSVQSALHNASHSYKDFLMDFMAKKLVNLPKSKDFIQAILGEDFSNKQFQMKILAHKLPQKQETEPLKIKI